MSRLPFGIWGTHVNRDEFSCALAALGIIGEGLTGLRSARRDVASLLVERHTAGVLDWVPWFMQRPQNIEPSISILPPAVLAEGWKGFLKRRTPGYESRFCRIT